MRRHRQLGVIGLAFTLVAAALGGMLSVASTTRASAASPTPVSFVANQNNDSVTEYSADATGDATPVATISGSSTGLKAPEGVVLDSSGNVFVTNRDIPSVTEYRSGATGNATPIATISGSNTGLNHPQGLALDPSGNIFVVNNDGNASFSVTEYAKGANGNVAPVTDISGLNTALDEPFGVAVDSSGTVLVANNVAPTDEPVAINEYAKGATGNVAPTATISGPATGLHEPHGLGFDSSENLFVTDLFGFSVSEFAKGATGNVAPIRTISGSSLNGPEGVAVDTSGTIHVANEAANTVTEYDQAATGDSPSNTIAGAGTGLSGPSGIAVAPALRRAYHPVRPARITDTRSGSGKPNAGMTLHAGGTLDIHVTGAGGVPASGVTAAVLNVTATDPTASSFLTVYPTGATRPTASNLNFKAGQTVPNLTELGLGTGGEVTVYNSTGSVDVIVDVEGYVGPTTTYGTGLYTPLTPSRIADTRPNSGFPNHDSTLGPGDNLVVQAAGAGGVPSTGVAAVTLNVTATNPTAASFLTVYQTGVLSRPTASNLNFSPGQTVPNRVIVPVGTGGRVSIFNSAGSVDVIVDIGGYFTDASNHSATGTQFTPTSPARITDTRSGSGKPNAGNTLGPGATLDVKTAGVGGVPASGVSAAVLNVTVTNTTKSSFLTVWPTGVNRPVTSDLNWVAGETVPNMVVVSLGSDGHIQVFNGAGSVDVIVDVSGWYS